MYKRKTNILAWLLLASGVVAAFMFRGKLSEMLKGKTATNAKK